MTSSLLLSRYKLQNFLACQRRFQLQYVTKLSWPRPPTPPHMARAFEAGEQFHRLMEQYFLGFPIMMDDEADPDLQAWWQTFQQHPPDMPVGKHFPELSLSVPIRESVFDENSADPHYLFGRYDLLVLGDDRAHIVDWKTERRPRDHAKLSADWQTRLYLTMLAEGAHALGRSYTPEQLSITYWFARFPKQSVTIQYDSDQHARNMIELRAEVGRLNRRLTTPDAVWPLTDNLQTCETCIYKTYCNRTVPSAERTEDDQDAAREDQPVTIQLEPAIPGNA